jgi:hypothetical protein
MTAEARAPVEQRLVNLVGARNMRARNYALHLSIVAGQVTGVPVDLALQLRFCFEVRALSGSLVRSAPE